METKTERKAPVFELAERHKRYIQQETEKATAICERIGQTWWKIGVEGLGQLARWGYKVDSPEVDEWDLLLGKMESHHLYCQGKFGSKELKEVFSFWDTMKARHPGGCACALKKTLNLVSELESQLEK